MKTILFITLLVVSTLAVTHRSITNAERLKIDTLKKSGTWGGYMVSLAEMHLMAQGPVDALINGIEEVLVDLEHKHNAADEAFAIRTQEHNSEIRRLTDLINEAKRQIAETQTTLQNVLRPQKAQLEESIADRERFITETIKYVADQTNQRAVEHQAYLVRVDETNAALAAIEEGLALLATLQEGGSSFAQMKKVKKAMDKIQEKLKTQKNIEKHFIKALIALATSEFADSGAVQRVVDKLNEIKNNMIAASLADSNNEEEAQQLFEADMAEKAQAVAEAQQQLEDLNQQLIATEEQIANAEQFIVDRTADVEGYQAEVDSENASYEEDTRIYEDLVAQFDKEQNACQQALEVIQGATFADYIGDRLSMDKVIDTNHGDGIATGAGTFDFQGAAPRIN